MLRHVALRSFVAASAPRALAAPRAAIAAAARPAAFVPCMRPFATAAAAAAEPSHPVTVESLADSNENVVVPPPPPHWPAGVPRRVDVNGVSWVDYRPESIRKISAERNEDGDLVGRFEGEDVIFPDLEVSLEWVLTSPVDVHLFEEAPIIKAYEEEQQDYPEMADANFNTSAKEPTITPA